MEQLVLVRGCMSTGNCGHYMEDGLAREAKGAGLGVISTGLLSLWRSTTPRPAGRT